MMSKDATITLTCNNTVRNLNVRDLEKIRKLVLTDVRSDNQHRLDDGEFIRLIDELVTPLTEVLKTAKEFEVNDKRSIMVITPVFTLDAQAQIEDRFLMDMTCPYHINTRQYTAPVMLRPADQNDNTSDFVTSLRDLPYNAEFAINAHIRKLALSRFYLREKTDGGKLRIVPMTVILTLEDTRTYSGNYGNTWISHLKVAEDEYLTIMVDIHNWTLTIKANRDQFAYIAVDFGLELLG